MTFVDGVYLVSNSEVQSFKSCRRQWWLAWHRGLQSNAAVVEGPLGTGNRVHRSLATYYVSDGEVSEDPAVTLERFILEDLEAIEANLEADPFGLERLAKLKAQFELERIMLAGYLEWVAETGVDAYLKVIAPETYVEADFAVIRGVRVRLIGKLDARVINLQTGRRLFIDHKTAQSLEDRGRRQLEQMLHYHLIEFLNTEPSEERCDGALYNVLKKVKRTVKATPPFYLRQQIDHNQYELDAYHVRLYGVISNMLEVEEQLARTPRGQEHQFVYPTPTRDCHWKCPFFKVCPMFDDGSRVEQALERHYVTRDPLSYYGSEQPREE